MRPFRRPRPDPAAFDAFYLDARRRLLLQCLALTGDLDASRSAVRDAFVAARQHWHKVGRLDHPEDWVRPRAWSIAQRRSVARIWHRERGLDPQQSAVLDALGALPDAQRRTLLLAHLAALSLGGIARELAQPQPVVEQQLQQATMSVALALDCDSALIRAQLESLAPLVTRPGLPRVTAVRRSAQRRHRLHRLGASTLGLLLALGAGWFVTAGDLPSTRTAADRTGASQKALHPQHPVTQALLLTAADVHRSHLARGHRWYQVSTDDGTGPGAAATPCQQTKFADEHGLGAWIRRFRTAGHSPRTLVQSVEVSVDAAAAARAYRTAVAWYAACGSVRGQLLGSWTVPGLGDRSQVVEVSTPAATWTVVATRTGAVTTRTALATPTGSPPLAPLVATATMAVRHLCTASAAGTCPVSAPRPVPAAPPPGDVPGMLAAVDLPPVPGVHRPWVGTTAATAVPNLAATPCDHTSFVHAQRARSRTFLVPQAHLPERFGLTETYGRFGSAAAARAFARTLEREMARCTGRDLGTTLSHHATGGSAHRGAHWSLWRETAEINARKATVSYWTGVVRHGRYVAQLTLTPVGRYDLSAPTFRALVVRSGQRLEELQ